VLHHNLERVIGSVICIFLLEGASAAPPVSQATAPPTGITSEGVVRSKASSMVLPTLGQGDGLALPSVAVCGITLRENGSIVSVSSLDVPSPAVGKAITEAVRQWKFGPLKKDADRDPTLVSATLTFYIVRQRGKMVALNPAETGYVGRWKTTGPKAEKSKGGSKI
jgi:hypothetical protein